MTKTCPICKKEFERLHNSHKYCSDDCKLIAKKLRYEKRKSIKQAEKKKADKPAVKKKVLTLNEVARLSRAEGLSYGEYSAKYLY